jgi:hypothetical protein
MPEITGKWIKKYPEQANFYMKVLKEEKYIQI